MKTINWWMTATLCLITFAGAGVTRAQAAGREDDQPAVSGRQESRNASESLSSAQIAAVKQILSAYEARALTAEQAKAIHAKFREAGLHGGPSLNDAVKSAGFDPDRLRDLAPPPGSGGAGRNSRDVVKREAAQPGAEVTDAGERAALERRKQNDGDGGRYSLDQAVSDRAQLNTIAFSGLAFLTSDSNAATFMPPGKVCDFFGFQYMRDIDAAEKGHNPMFLSRVAANVMHILNEQQRKLFEDLATEQTPQFEDLALKRMPLIKAFYLERDGLIPAGSAGLNREAVMRYVGDFYAMDAEMSRRRAEVFGRVATSLTPDQKTYLGKMKFGDFNTWPALDERAALKRPSPGVSRFWNVAYMTYASEFFSWYAGSVDADVYFCPERHGTYFGGFFMKDMPAMNKRDYDISTAVTGDSGEGFVKLLTEEQRKHITSITDQQRQALKEIVETRRAISVELRKYLAGGAADKARVLALGRRYGELDGEVSWMYAVAFSRVNKTLSADQRAALRKLRNLEGYQSAPAYMYSSPMQEAPALPKTDFLFRAPGKGP